VRTASKSPEAFRTISEVAIELDVPQHVLRFWETKFSQIKPMKRAGGRRYYRPDDVNLLLGIKTLLYTDGFTIKGVKKVLRERGLRYVIETGRMVGQDDRALPVKRAEPEIAPETTSVVAEDLFEAQEVEISEQPIVTKAAPSISEDQRAGLELILEELLEMKFSLDGARAGLIKAAESSIETEARHEPLLKRA